MVAVEAVLVLALMARAVLVEAVLATAQDQFLIQAVALAACGTAAIILGVLVLF